MKLLPNTRIKETQDPQEEKKIQKLPQVEKSFSFIDPPSSDEMKASAQYSYPEQTLVKADKNKFSMSFLLSVPSFL